MVLNRDAGEDRMVLRHPHGRHDLRHVAVGDARQQTLGLILARIEEQLRALRAEHVARVIEQRDHGQVKLARVLQDAAGLIEQLEPLVLLALGEVGPIGQEDGRQRDDQQRHQPRVALDDRYREQCQAGVGDGHQPPELDHLGQLFVLRRAARE